MGFFTEFSAWLDRVLVGYIADGTARMAMALEPAIVAACTLYVMIWGFLQLTGRIEEPLTDFLKRVAIITLVLGVSVRLWLYHAVIVDVFFNAPAQLAARIVGAYEPVTIVDEIFAQGADAAQALLAKAGVFQGEFSFYLAAGVVYLMAGLATVYTMFLLALSRVALSILLAIGPMFIALALFNSTRRFLEAWLAQLANYALIAILTVLVAALLMSMLTVATREAARTGGSIQIADAVRVALAAGLTFLCMRQVMPMASGLASGIALSTYGAMSAVMAWGVGSTLRHLGQFTRGAVMDRESTRWDPLSRKAGFQLAQGGRALVQRAVRRPNQLKPSHRR